jgi:hypothetical protein
MSYYTTNIQLGSKGDDVKKWQEYLRNNGHSMLNVNGTFDDDTLIATKEFQALNGLDESGDVGDSTWITAGFQKGTQTPPQTNAFDYASMLDALHKPNYDTTKYEDTKAGESASKKYDDAKHDLHKHGSFSYGNQEQLDDIMERILGRPEFSYRFNEDAFYQMYKDKFTKQGKMAMADAMGQASAMTGGYGNSYASTVGNQAYLSQLNNLNDIVPELWQMAYDAYNQEGQNLYNQYGLLNSDYERALDTHNQTYNELMDALDIAKGDYYSGMENFYTEQNKYNALEDQKYKDALEILNSKYKDSVYQDEVIREALKDMPEGSTLSASEFVKIRDAAMSTYETYGEDGLLDLLDRYMEQNLDQETAEYIYDAIMKVAE